MRGAKRLVIILFVAALTSLFFWKVLAHPAWLMSDGTGDLAQLFSMRTHFQAESTLSTGEMALWDPYANCGMPIVGNIQTATFYPLSFLFYVMPTNAAFGVIFMANTLLAGLFAYMFVRSFKLRRGAAFGAAIVYMFSGVWTPRLEPGHIMVYNNLPWIMLGLYLVRKMVLSALDGKWGASVFIALLLALSQAAQFFGGHTQFWFYSTFALCAYCVFEVVCGLARGGKGRAIGAAALFVGAMAVFLLVVMIQLLPSLEFARQVLAGLERPASYRSSIGFSNAMLLMFFMPNSLYAAGQWEACSYIGIVTLVMVVAAVLLVRNRYVWYFAAVGVLALAFAVGEGSPVFKLLGSLPGFMMFRAPSRMITVALPSAVVLFAFAWDTVFSGGLARRGKIVLVCVAILVALIPAGIFAASKVAEGKIKQGMLSRQREEQKRMPGFPENLTRLQKEWIADGEKHIDERVDDMRRLAVRAEFLALLGCAIMIATAVTKSQYIRLACGIACIMLISVDLVGSGTTFVHTTDPAAFFPKHNALLDHLARENSRFRILDKIDNQIMFMTSETPYHYLRRANYNVVNGDLDSSRLLDYTAYYEHEKLGGNDLLNALNVKYVLSDEPLTEPLCRDWPKTKLADNLFVTENPNCLPRAFVVGKVISMKGRSADEIAEFLTKSNLKEMAVIEADLPAKLEDAGAFKPAEVTNYEANRVTVEVTLDKPGFLILSEIWYPDWHAYETEGGAKKELPLYKTDVALRGVYLDAGKHKVEFIYEPRTYFTGAKITIASLAAVLVLLVVSGIMALRRHRLEEVRQ